MICGGDSDIPGASQQGPASEEQSASADHLGGFFLPAEPTSVIDEKTENVASWATAFFQNVVGCMYKEKGEIGSAKRAGKAGLLNTLNETVSERSAQ